MKPRKRPTLYDVARESGVSYQTVSRVVNNHPRVAPETRQRVNEVIIALDYQPSRAAQNLAGQNSNTLGLLLYGFALYGPTQMAVHIEQAAREQGYDLIIFTSPDMSNTNIAHAAQFFKRWEVEGVLMVTPILGIDNVELEQNYGVPIVQIDTRLGEQSPSVVIDQAHGSQLATQHLIDLGHRQICEISGPLNWYGAQARHAGWLDTLQRNQLEPSLHIEGDWTAHSGYHATKSILQSRQKFTAIVAGNDQMALGAMFALKEAGFRIPDDVSIVGFDDIPETTYFDPPLTTIRQDFASLGQQGINYLIERIQKPDQSMQQVVLPTELIKRLSTR